MVELLRGEGRQAAIYTYPSDQPIADSARDFGAKLADLRLRTPGLQYDLLCHSMGGLVARDYVESESYRGGVERLILLGTPNRGSSWAGYRLALEFEEHYDLWQHEPDWSPSWMITDGLGEAGGDLKPGSKFLRQLNARGPPRGREVHDRRRQPAPGPADHRQLPRGDRRLDSGGDRRLVGRPPRQARAGDHRRPDAPARQERRPA
jgi:pimeloyl-ACP methyl ester carboxylesterase